jgi:hypothetical protein
MVSMMDVEKSNAIRPGYGKRHDEKDSQLKAGTFWPAAARQRPAGETAYGDKPTGAGQKLG